MALEDALDAWRAALGPEAVSTDPADLAGLAADTSDHQVPPVARLRPADADGVAAALRIAAREGVPLHPVSSGRNWGYGSANAYAPGCATLDLSRMAAIRHFDDELGLLTVEPGVTQGALRAWLDAHGHAFMVPTTGAGPSCSLVGNALERGYGLTPFADHFSAVVALEAVMPDGTRYASPLGTGAASGGFKWGIGPYLDGLFAQGNLGVVTAMTLALVRRPEVVETVYFWIDRDDGLESAVDAVRDTLRAAGASLGGLNLISAERFLAMSGGAAGTAAALQDRDGAARAAHAAGAAAWMGVGAIFGTRAQASATRALIRARIGPVARRIVFVSTGKARFIERILRRLPGARAAKLRQTAHIMRQGLDLLEGRPGEVALPLAYAGSGTPPADGPRHPARDGCGLLWYAPIVAMRATDARRFVALARETCAAHGFAAPVTLSSLSDRSFDCTLPLLFDRADPAACAAADACWRALLQAGRSAGFVPYRVPGRYAALMRDDANAFWSTLDAIKRAVDPAGLVSPGRWDAGDAA